MPVADRSVVNDVQPQRTRNHALSHVVEIVGAAVVELHQPLADLDHAIAVLGGRPVFQRDAVVVGGGTDPLPRRHARCRVTAKRRRDHEIALFNSFLHPHHRPDVGLDLLDVVEVVAAHPDDVGVKPVTGNVGHKWRFGRTVSDVSGSIPSKCVNVRRVPCLTLRARQRPVDAAQRTCQRVGAGISNKVFNAVRSPTPRPGSGCP